jgi:flagellar basal-body rod protein FlgB
MPISNIPIFSMLRSRMQWQQERQRVLAENVANADTPGFQPRDVAPPTFDRPAPIATGLTLQRTNVSHIGGVVHAGGPQLQGAHKIGQEIRPTGNAVSLEDEMMKVAANQMDYQAVAAIYGRSLSLIKTAMGRG